MRYKAVFTTTPSIATLLELSIHEVSDLDPAVFGVLLASGQLAGRVLLQNELSRDYWGDLAAEGKEGKCCQRLCACLCSNRTTGHLTRRLPKCKAVRPGSAPWAVCGQQQCSAVLACVAASASEKEAMLWRVEHYVQLRWGVLG